MLKKQVFFLYLICLPMAFLSQSNNPLLTKNAEAQKVWVDRIFNALTLEEKIGQLFMVQAYSNKDEKHQKEIEELITKYHIGNLIFMQGTTKKQAFLNFFLIICL